MRLDNDGNLWIVEDIGGRKTGANYVQRRQAAQQLCLPLRPDKSDLGSWHGVLQVLQVDGLDGAPVTSVRRGLPRRLTPPS